MPGLPGAACSSVSDGDEPSFQASACSRPPDPTRSTRTRRVYEPRRHVDRGRDATACEREHGVARRAGADERPTGTPSASATNAT